MLRWINKRSENFVCKNWNSWKSPINMGNAIRGTLRTEIIGNGNINIRRFLMSRGPLYLKSVNIGKLKIGDNVFFNHNCSVTCAELQPVQW